MFSFPSSRADGVMIVDGPTGSFLPLLRAERTSSSETNSKVSTDGGGGSDTDATDGLDDVSPSNDASGAEAETEEAKPKPRRSRNC